MEMSYCGVHSFLDSEELQKLRVSLLDWYRRNKRELPWRERVSSVLTITPPPPPLPPHTYTQTFGVAPSFISAGSERDRFQQASICSLGVRDNASAGEDVASA